MKRRVLWGALCLCASLLMVGGMVAPFQATAAEDKGSSSR